MRTAHLATGVPLEIADWLPTWCDEVIARSQTPDEAGEAIRWQLLRGEPDS